MASHIIHPKSNSILGDVVADLLRDDRCAINLNRRKSLNLSFGRDPAEAMRQRRNATSISKELDIPQNTVWRKQDGPRIKK
jgi:hypothetical protein